MTCSCARVYVNGVLVGEHRGGYSAFACEIQQEVRFGQDNEITVIADNASRPDVILVNHFLFGVYGGILHLEMSPEPDYSRATADEDLPYSFSNK